jgi:hypothetical protein
MSLDTLKEPVLLRILSFVSNVPDFQSCACVSRRFRDALKDDEVWKYCKGKWSQGIKSDRGRAAKAYEESAVFIKRALKSIRTHQRAEINFILKVLGVEGWEKLVHKILNKLPFQPCCHVRGDSLSTLVHLVEDNTVKLLGFAHLLVFHRLKGVMNIPY